MRLKGVVKSEATMGSKSIYKEVRERSSFVYGWYIKVDGQDDVFVHPTQIMGDGLNKKLNIGDKVQFELEDNGKTRIARKVAILKKAK
jgi:cold shock CspA family protein